VVIAQVILWAAAAYLGLGVMFALPFVIVGAGRIDPSARDASWAFRVLILPGSAALWPCLLVRWLHASRFEEGSH
jgi:hypothetical protein